MHDPAGAPLPTRAPPSYVLEEVLRTADGALIELRRLPAPPAGPAPLPPVLLVHGIAANHRNLDLRADVSPARRLAALGRDVWLLTLRCGRQQPRHGGSRACFSGMARHDLPLATEAILARTGAAQIDYVGFSMGGMLLYAALGRAVPEERIRRAILVAAPGRVSLPAWLGLLPRAVVPRVPSRLIGRALAGVGGRAGSPWLDGIVDRAAAAPGLLRMLLVDCLVDVPVELCRELISWAAAGGEITVDGERALEALAGAEVPALFIAAAGDRIAPVAAVREAFDAWGRDRPRVAKRMLVLSRLADHATCGALAGTAPRGGGADHNHWDLMVGASPAVEVSEHIAAFLCAEAAAEATMGGASEAAG